MKFILTATLVALGSLFVKGLFTCFVPSEKIPPFAERILKYIPPAALAALVAPAIFYTRTQSGNHFSPSRFLAGMIAFCIALYTRNVIITIASGMGLLILFQTFMG